MIQNRYIKDLMAKAARFCWLADTGLKPGATKYCPGLQSGDKGALTHPALAFNNSTSFNRLAAQSSQPKAIQP